MQLILKIGVTSWWMLKCQELMNIATGTQHVHELSSWTRLPRVQYLKSRYMDLHKRFSRAAGAFPASWHDINILNQLRELCTALEKHPRIIVTGDDVELKEFNIEPKDIDCKIGDMLAVRVFYKRDLQLENWKQCLKNLIIQTEDGESRMSADILVFGTCSTTTNEENADSIESLKTWFREKEIGIPVLVLPKQKELSDEIEKILEEHIIRGFERLYLYIHQYFIRKNITYNFDSTDVLNLDMIVAVVMDTVQDGDLSSRSMKRADTATDYFENEIIRTICRRLLCGIVSPLAAKYNIREFLCYKLLTEVHFEKPISKAVSRNTRHRLSKVCRAQDRYMNSVSSILQGHVLHEVLQTALSLREDIHNIDVFKTRRVTTVMRVTAVMRKMTFEIKGYLRQSLVSSCILDIEIPRPKISAKLLHGILRLKSVCTMRIVYGELEIHVSSESEKSEADVRNEIAEQMRKHEYHFPYIIKVVDQTPEHFVRQGDKTLSPDPNDRSQYAIGSVGCFVKDQQGMPYLLTCAHVVASPDKKRQIVLIEKNVDGKQKFGLSTRQKRIHSGDEENFPLVDIAAVGAADSIRGLIDYTMRDDSGKPKSVSFLCDFSKEVVGTTVYKYGASTGLTYGLVSSVVVGTHLYEMVVENPPDISDNDEVLDAVNFKRDEHAKVPHIRSFAERGDSGALICFNDYYADHTGTIIAAAMLSAGDYLIKNDSSPKYLGFSLEVGMGLLSKRGCHFIM